jgi:cellobiose transport system permease protein
MSTTTTKLAPPVSGPVAGRRRWGARLDSRISPYLYVAPFFALFAVFGLFPLAYTLYVSLNQWDLIGGGLHTFVGLDNYRRLLADADFWNSLRNTLSIGLLATVPQLLLALVLAQLLNARIRARTLFRMGVLLPNITSVAAVAIIFGQLFGRDFGVVNWLLGLIGVAPIDWQAGRATSHLAVATMVNWRWAGYNALIYLAAMQAIPRELYDAAAIDGAGIWKQLWRITVPMLRPTIIFTVTVSTIFNLQLFAEPLLFDANPGSATGGTDRQFQTVALFLYEQAFRQFRLGYGSAVAWALFLVVVVFSLLSYLLTRRIRSAAP